MTEMDGCALCGGATWGGTHLPGEMRAPCDSKGQARTGTATLVKTRTNGAARTDVVKLAPAVVAPPPARAAVEPLDWASLFAEDHTRVNWLLGRLCERGQQVALVGEGKAGKSLFALEWAWRMGSALPFLGHGLTEPLTVVYADRENSQRDLYMRLIALGATPEQLEQLVYYSFPSVAYLDESGADFVALVERHKADVVIIDTVSRFIAGKENDSDTWLSLYRNVHQKLKAAGTACVRLDHFGKDTERGARGSGAKSQDVDHVWELHVQAEQRDGVTVTTKLRLKRTHTRSGVGPDVIDIDRVGVKDDRGEMWVAGATGHQLSTEPVKVWSGEGAREIARRLDEAGVPRFWGRDKVKEEGVRLGIKQSSAVWAAVVRYRKEQHVETLHEGQRLIDPDES